MRELTLELMQELQQAWRCEECGAGVEQVAVEIETAETTTPPKRPSAWLPPGRVAVARHVSFTCPNEHHAHIGKFALVGAGT